MYCVWFVCIRNQAITGFPRPTVPSIPPEPMALSLQYNWGSTRGHTVGGGLVIRGARRLGAWSSSSPAASSKGPYTYRTQNGTVPQIPPKRSIRKKKPLADLALIFFSVQRPLIVGQVGLRDERRQRWRHSREDRRLKVNGVLQDKGMVTGVWDLTG